MSAKFVTVTLSPVFERTLVLQYLAVGYQNQAVGPERLDPSGQGVNVARALRQLDCETHAVVLLGDDLTGRAYCALVAEEGLGLTAVYVDGTTCSQTDILDTGNDRETRIIAEGAEITESDIQQLAESLKESVTAEDTVVLAGPLPAGAPADSYARLIEVVHAAGAEAVLAADAPALKEALAARPEMAVLSQLQCEAFYNVPIRVQRDLLTAAHKLRGQGVDRVLIEMQESGGALLVTGEGQWRVDMPAAREGTTTGVWEALLAGFLAGRCREHRLGGSLEMAGAAAAYTSAEVGAEFGSPQDVEEHLADVEVRKIDEDQESKGSVPEQNWS